MERTTRASGEAGARLRSTQVFAVIVTVVVGCIVARSFSCRTVPAEAEALYRRLPEGTGGGWSDEDLHRFAEEAWALAESHGKDDVARYALAAVESACTAGGTAAGSARVRADNVERWLAIASDDDRDPWSSLLIGLGQVWRLGAEGRVEADSKLAGLDRIERAARSPLIRAVVLDRRVELYLGLDRMNALREPEERSAALRALDVLESRRGDLNAYWSRPRSAS